MLIQGGIISVNRSLSFKGRVWTHKHTFPTGRHFLVMETMTKVIYLSSNKESGKRKVPGLPPTQGPISPPSLTEIGFEHITLADVKAARMRRRVNEATERQGVILRGELPLSCLDRE